jgi:HSP20 family protein
MRSEIVPRTSGLLRPWRRWERELEDLMERFTGPDFRLPFGEEEFAPRMNVAETDAQVEVTVDLPGMKPEEFNVELKNGELWVTGERKEEKEEKGKNVHRVERHYGAFRRVVTLPTPVDEKKVTADYHEGVLKITLPKSEAVKPKHIEVKT